MKCVEPATLTTDLVKTHDALQRMVSALHAAAPAAVLVFVTYPRMVPDGNCPALGFTDADAAILRDMGAKLEQVFVDTFKNTNVVFVDPYAAPGDHTACAAPSERWEAGHVAPGGFPYHPTALGHQVMAQMIAAALQKQ